MLLLLRNGEFDLGAQKGVFSNPLLLTGLFLLWLVTFIGLVALRWSWTANAIGLTLPFRAALTTHLGSVFLSTWLPSGIGGDFWKAYRFGRLAPTGAARSAAYFSVILDRAIGLYAMLVLGAICILADFSTWWDSSYLIFAIAELLLCAAVTIVAALLFRRSDRLTGMGEFGSGCSWFWDPLANLLSKHSGRLSADRVTIIYCFLLSCVIQSANIAFLECITNNVTGLNVDFSTLAAVFSIGTIVIILSMVPGGFGIGHLLFFALLQSFGIPNGADIFNVYFVLTAGFSLIGLTSYFWPGDIRPS